jgi:hypothetical protein
VGKAAQYRIGEDLKRALARRALQEELSLGDLSRRLLGDKFGVETEAGNARLPRLADVKGEFLFLTLPELLQDRIKGAAWMYGKTQNEVVTEILQDGMEKAA